MKLQPAYSISVYCLKDKIEDLIKGIYKVYPFTYGNYERVYWLSDGIDSHYPLPESGIPEEHKGIHYQESSVRIEFFIDKDETLLQKIIDEGIIPNHPWEEPVISVTEVRRSLLTP